MAPFSWTPDQVDRFRGLSIDSTSSDGTLRGDSPLPGQASNTTSTRDLGATNRARISSEHTTAARNGGRLNSENGSKAPFRSRAFVDLTGEESDSEAEIARRAEIREGKKKAEPSSDTAPATSRRPQYGMTFDMNPPSSIRKPSKTSTMGIAAITPPAAARAKRVITMEDYEDYEVEIEELLRGDDDRTRASANPPPMINPVGIPHGWKQIKSYPGPNNRFYEASMTRCVSLIDESFLQIESVIQDKQTTEVKLRGWRLVRTNTLGGNLERKLNELVFCFEYLSNDARDVWAQNLEIIAINQVKTIRKLIRTNALFPQHRFNHQDAIISRDPQEKEKYAKEKMILVVRWMYLKTFATDYERRDQQRLKIECKRAEKYELRTLLQHEIPSEYFVPLEMLREDWQNATAGSSVSPEKSFGSHSSSSKSSKISTKRKAQEVIDLDTSDDDAVASSSKKARQDKSSKGRLVKVVEEDEDMFIVEADGKRPKVKVRGLGSSALNIVGKYTHGDVFAGAGGSARGAEIAGFRTVWALDKDAAAMRTFRSNFPDAKHDEMTIHDFHMSPDDSIRIDVLHISPPCQPYSPANTRGGKNDYDNVATLFGSGIAAIDRRKPRFCTLEETSGILWPTHQGVFNSFIQLLTARGFSVSWRIINFAEYGLAQNRERCIIFAAAPGETLWEMPPKTHSKGGKNGLKPLVTPRQVLAGMPRNLRYNHDLIDARAKFSSSIPFGDGPVGTICCRGRLQHPNLREQRALTVREMATLQGFPLDHEFFGTITQQIQQIGNAVPPSMSAIWNSPLLGHMFLVDNERS